jgi:hypothetical protein
VLLVFIMSQDSTFNSNTKDFSDFIKALQINDGPEKVVRVEIIDEREITYMT